ncbi:tripartite tricarboxylate transporter TctB family protein [Acuticoccus sp. MNP-M23]|uniref:tripartite tricarboxylate transporter TctB family protein n=1 Tax=Acuticoccus sp. MNP-M23 TaxID=3072793 RepID=UPI002814F00D|nr:tripartite tricarboxylate transporter TctB family protein [Acuticoccus sp. MNP-M23]WMS41495.1 tripartite tricarboxylate transporter TctB family protein [Acuticoccus sp. MNP-M23]
MSGSTVTEPPAPNGMEGASASSAPDGETANEARAAELAKLASYVFFLLGAGVFFTVSLGLPDSRWEPLGAGSFPRIVMGFLALLCVLAIAGSARRLARIGLPDGLARLSGAAFVEHRLVISVFVAFAVYLALMRPLGFAISTFLFLIVAQLIVARRTLKSALIALVVAVVFSFGLNLLFAKVFLVFLPRGILGGLLG